jgi:multiple sugar transport system substrate-binding protein
VAAYAVSVYGNFLSLVALSLFTYAVTGSALGLGVLADLQPFIDEGVLDVGEVPDGILDAGRYQGQLYMISMGNPYMAMQYNQDALEADGVEAPPLDWTWDYYFDWLLEWAEASDDGAPWPSGGHADGEQQWFGWLIGQGIQPFTEDGGLGFEREHLAEWYSRWLEMQEAGAQVVVAGPSEPE